MIFIATVHWRNDKWIDIQKYYLGKYISSDYQIYAYLDESLEHFKEEYHFALCDPTESHEEKLNVLADNICQDSKDDNDIIIFIDGDAFPINSIDVYIQGKINEHPLLAVRRTEENGEKQPHPCFCITTVGFWKKIKGDWSRGYEWKNNDGSSITDVGGNLLGILKEHNIDWLPLERSNRYDHHPVLFAIYNDIVYHHGAGFRYPDLRVNIFSTNRVHTFIQNTIIKYVPIKIRHLLSEELRFKLRAARKVININQKISNTMYYQILNDPSFIKNYFERGEGRIMMREPKKCVLVIGMHRSGTSCLMGTIKKYGIYTGEVNIQDQYNERGTLENTEIYLLNKKILKYNKGSWENPPNEIKWTNEHANIRNKLISKFQERTHTGVWGFKDPRTTITLPFWLDGLSNYKIVASYRNPNSVAHSLSKRGDISLSIDKGLELWTQYNKVLLKHIDEQDISLVSFDQPKQQYNDRIKNILIEAELINETYIANHTFYIQHLHHSFSDDFDHKDDTRKAIYQQLEEHFQKQIKKKA